MDTIDTKIICQLMADGRVTNACLARAVGLSESATLERVRRLESKRIIGGYAARVEPAQFGRPLEVLMTFTLKNQSPEQISQFEDAMRAMDEVLFCAQVLGRFDFIAHVAVRDVKSLETFINERVVRLGVVDRMESMTILKMPKRWHAPRNVEAQGP